MTFIRIKMIIGGPYGPPFRKLYPPPPLISPLWALRVSQYFKHISLYFEIALEAKYFNVSGNVFELKND